MTKVKIFFKISVCLLLLSAMDPGLADTSRRSPSNDGTYTAGPYYNSTTKSYFELVRINSTSWQEAYSEANSRKFKNTSGRLAIISRPETHRFLVRQFTFLQDTWIGLRLICENSKQEWVSGLSQTGNIFSNWSQTNEQTTLSCPETGYLYTYINANAFDWTLANSDESSNYTLIEYPTGKR